MSQKYTIEDMKQLALRKNGECLSLAYEGVKQKLVWRCENGHQWEATPDSVLRGTWCPNCTRYSKKPKYTIEDMQQFARSRGGECLSSAFKNCNSKLFWQCSEGHQWEAKVSHVLRGSWCPECNIGRPITIEEMQEIAQARGGKCLSEKYLGPHKKLVWECAKGHRWENTPSNIKYGKSWCGKCWGKYASIADMKAIAEARGGKCLSEHYVNSQKKLTWTCSAGHVWEAEPASIKQGRWCPECTWYISEQICRVAFEQIFKTEFKKAYPSWLRNERGNKMELDGYSLSLKIAFEHHGEQHEEINFFSPTTEFLERRKKDDAWKAQLCQQHGVRLIQLPQILGKVDLEDVKGFIGTLCLKNGVQLPDDFEEINLELNQAYRVDLLAEIKRIAHERGGECLSQYYLSGNIKLKFRCSNNHVWQATPRSISAGHWCRKCAGVEKKTLEEMKTLSQSKGGECLSTTYEGANAKLQWRCSEGHEWAAKPAHIVSGHWCPDCAGNKTGDIEQMKQIALSRGGICLSEHYVNQMTKLRWRCAKGHEWETTAGSIKSGSWCPDCGGSKKKTIEEMRRLAAKHSGKFVSSLYLNSGTKYIWECSRGHQFLATANNVRTGYWCPMCGRKRTNLSLQKRKLTLQEMQSIAHAKGGTSLSTEYQNQSTKLRWQCAQQHQWLATPKNIKKGRWCPLCAKLKRKHAN